MLAAMTGISSHSWASEKLAMQASSRKLWQSRCPPEAQSSTVTPGSSRRMRA